MAQSEIKYNFEYEKKLKVCFIGAGGHSYRNIYPTFQYAPIELMAICDKDEKKAEAYAKQFGAHAYYTDHLKMLEIERPDAVFIVTSYHPDGSVQGTDLAMDALKAGAHVWMEKPTAASTQEIQQLMAASKKYNRYCMTGLKKIFFPSIEKVKEIISLPEFGQPSSIYIRYPQPMPPLHERQDLTKITSLLDHIFHPAAIIHYLMGKIEHITYEWEPYNGGSVTSIKFLTGAVGTLHMAAGLSGSSPLERLEVVGEGSNIIVENGVKVTYYRKASLPAYGRAASFLVDNEAAPLHWEPEFSLGQLYNKNLFYLGYVQEINYFCECILNGKLLQKGTLEEALEILKLLEAYRHTLPGTNAIVNINE